MNIGFTRKYREIYNLIKENRNARDIFDYLCNAAAWKPYETKIGSKTYKLQIGELIASAGIIAEETAWKENRKKVTYTTSEVKMALAFLEKVGAIFQEVLPTKIHGSKITVFCYTAEGKLLYNREQQPEETLEPEGTQHTPQPEKHVPQPELQPELQPEETLEPQGMKQDQQPELQPELQPTLIKNVFKNVFKKKDLDDDDILGLASKISTFGMIERNKFMNSLIENKFGYLPQRNFFDELTKIENDLGYEVACYAALQINGKINNPQSFFIDFVDKMRQNGVKTLEEAMQFAAQEKERNSKRYKPTYKKTGTEAVKTTGSFTTEEDRERYKNMF